MSARVEHLAEGVTLYLGDCLEIAPELLRADAVISDVPYGIGYNHSGNGNRFFHQGVRRKNRMGPAHVMGANEVRGQPPIEGDARPFDPAPWVEFDNVMLFGADHFFARLPDRGRWLAWNKLGDLEPWDSFSDVEFIWHSRPGAARIFSMKWKGIACDKKGEANGLREHPTQKPIALMKWCVAQSGAEVGATILDPYMGAGTTGVAAVALGRRFVGVEKIERWFDIACRRIGDALKQPDMLITPPPRCATQGGLDL